MSYIAVKLAPLHNVERRVSGMAGPSLVAITKYLRQSNVEKRGFLSSQCLKSQNTCFDLALVRVSRWLEAHGTQGHRDTGIQGSGPWEQTHCHSPAGSHWAGEASRDLMTPLLRVCATSQYC